MLSTPRVLVTWDMWLHFWTLPSPWDRPLPQLHFPSDPWDPGLTAQDLLFRGGPKFRRQPRAVLDVTEQVSGPTRE